MLFFTGVCVLHAQSLIFFYFEPVSLQYKLFQTPGDLLLFFVVLEGDLFRTQDKTRGGASGGIEGAVAPVGAC